MRVRARLASFIFVISFTAVVRPTLACSICGCDPAASTLGVERPAAQVLRVALEDRMLAKESGSGDDAESERENRMVLRGQYAILPGLVVQAELPFYLWKRHLDSTGVQDDDAHGLGDVSLGLRYELFRIGGMIPRHTLAVLGSLKLPSGANSRNPNGDDVIDEHIQLGTGTFDEQVSLSYVYGDLPWALFASAGVRVNGTNSRGFQYGNALFASAGVRRNFLDSSKLLVSLEAQVRSAGKDRFGAGAAQPYDPDSGGQVYYGTASVAYALTEELLLRGLVQVPVATALNGTQGEHVVGYLQLAYDFAL